MSNHLFWWEGGGGGGGGAVEGDSRKYKVESRFLQLKRKLVPEIMQEFE